MEKPFWVKYYENDQRAVRDQPGEYWNLLGIGFSNPRKPHRESEMNHLAEPFLKSSPTK